MLKMLAISGLLASSVVTAFELPENQLDLGKVKAKDKVVVLLGQGVQEGQTAPNFKVADVDFSPVTLKDFANQAVLISVVPSLDTGICSLQTKHFNEKVATQFPDVAMLTISADLPFAQKRFCKAENIDKVKTLSDSVWHSFGENYGLLIKDMGLLSRAIFVLDKNHTIVYKQLVENLATEPDYASAVNALKALQ
ncbi:thiol peroxidase [Pseudoalteromonas sp. T1lg65]|uniref:thiol peroxidase n=1 Tax=Pseudoalteromonas sp. T1lg65 TaxID=2077101 RepID=UPI003F7A7D98